VNLTRITVVAALAAGAALLPATASAATGVSISGTTWHDLNVDSVCQTGEPALSGKNVFVQAGKIQLVDQDGVKRETRPNDEGDYRFDDLPAGEYRLPAMMRDDADGCALTPQGPDSKVDWLTGWTAPIVITNTGVDHVDIGYFKASGNTTLKAAHAPARSGWATRSRTSSTSPTTATRRGASGVRLE
jgi:hypothetical protein